jgi:hypothetical protein
MFFDLIDIFITFLGVIALLVICAYVVVMLPGKIEQFMRKQNKIKCLCKHEYVQDLFWEHGGRKEYGYHCRKCGKSIEINVYEDDFK